MIKNLINTSFSEKKYIDFLKETLNLKVKQIEIKKVDNNEYIDTYQELGFIEINDIDELGFLIIKSLTPNIENIRVGFNAFIGDLIKADKYEYDGLIVAIYHPKSDVWRLSYVALELDDNRQLSTKPKRYTFELGEKIPTTTAESQLKLLNTKSTLEEIKEAFSVEKLSNEFFRKYKELYFELIKDVKPINKDKASNRAIEDEKEISSYIKKMLGRIVFLYFVQKKGWLDDEKKFLSKLLKTCIEETPNIDFYDEVMEVLFFEALNKKRTNNLIKLGNKEYSIPYLNGGLFNPDDYDDLDISISNEYVEKIFNLFDSYNFTIIEDSPTDSEVAIDPEMLGRVFEDLLEDRKDKGAFYTPREIVHYMCEQSIQNYMQTKPKDITELEYIKNIKVLDPAIGSGAFPMGMLHEILQTRVILGDKTPLAKLKREIIQNSIYGIDIEPSAVEIAKLRFWLSIVVDEEVENIEDVEPLPNLFYKIMVGNSLVETIDNIDPLKGKTKKSLNDLESLFNKYYEEHKDKNGIKNKINIKLTKLFKTLLDSYSNQLLLSGTEKELKANQKETEVAKQVTIILKELQTNHFSDKIFLYKLFFRDVLQNGGFDVLIGNPPYLRVQGIDKNSSEQYKKIYKSATGSYDLYVLFTEKALELLSKNGIVNYIMPHKWINASFGKGLRTISKDKISKFISFGAYQVFNASTYTSLVWLQNNKKSNHLKYVELNRDLTTNQELEKYLTELNDDSYTKIQNKDLTSDNWIFTNKKTYEVLEKLKQQPLRVSDIFEKIFQGLATSKDSVYFLKDCKEVDGFVSAFSDELQKNIKIEKGLVKPLLKGDDVHRYNQITTNKMVIFPYYIILENDKEKAELYTEDELKTNFPNGYKYLKECEAILRGRERGRFNINGEWFQYGRKQGILDAHKEKLIQPDISLGGNFAYDKDGEFYQTTTLYGYKKYDNIKESYLFYMAILNSKLLWWYLTQTGTTLTNGYFRFKPNYLNPFPMPKINNIEDTKPFETLVDEIMDIRKNFKSIESPLVKAKQIRKMQEAEKTLDEMVYELYGLSDDEVRVIEESV